MPHGKCGAPASGSCGCRPEAARRCPHQTQRPWPLSRPARHLHASLRPRAGTPAEAALQGQLAELQAECAAAAPPLAAGGGAPRPQLLAALGWAGECVRRGVVAGPPGRGGVALLPVVCALPQARPRADTPVRLRARTARRRLSTHAAPAQCMHYT